jgi:tellurium resistance protein
MRRLPVFFLIDVSESMVGAPIESVQNGMRTIVQDLRTDPYALETAFLSVISFAGKSKVLSPLTELYKFYPPVFPIGGGTSLGNALSSLMEEMDKTLVPTTEAQKGDWKPIVFLFTDGTPTDDYALAFARWNQKYRSKANLVAISIGDNVNTQMLGQISDNVLRLNETDESTFSAFFKWITASIKATSISVSDLSDDSVKLAPTSNLNLEKVDLTKPSKVDENFVVLLGKCSQTKQPYLVKYAKRAKELDAIPGLNLKAREYRLIGAYPIDEESYTQLSDGQSNRHINSKALRGVPACPCCGGQLGVVVCECGHVMCASSHTNVCPWCGLEGELGEGGASGFELERSKG